MAAISCLYFGSLPFYKDWINVRLRLCYCCSALCLTLIQSWGTLVVTGKDHRRIQGGAWGARAPPLDHLKLSVFFELFFCWCTGLAQLAYRFMNIAGDERMRGKYLSRASEWGRFLEMRYEKCLLLLPPPPLNRDGSWRPRKISATTPPPLNRDGFWRSRNISATSPPSQLLCPS